jgi:uncharacterized protein
MCDLAGFCRCVDFFGKRNFEGAIAMKRILPILLLLLAGTPSLGLADDAPPAAAHPSLWTIHGKHGTVYLFGSVHILPPGLVWRVGDIDKAIAASDVFVFEVQTDQDKIKQLVADKGTLPAGQSLRAMLPPESQADLDADTALLNIPESAIDNRRPWLAALVLSVVRLRQENYSPSSGVDFILQGDAAARGKPIRYLETIEQQFALLAPDDPKLELESFETDLKSFKTEKDSVEPLVVAWSSADQKQMEHLTLDPLKGHSDIRKAMFDDRNHAWIKPIEAMLDGEDKVFFVTVGASHMVGEQGVPALLRADGYKVDGP